jgi:alpha-L-fucosidase
MKVNGEAIYGTTASPFQRLSWGRATQKPRVLYLHVFDWPADGRLVVPMQGEVRAARVLGSDATLRWGASEQESGRLVIEVPTTPVDSVVSVVRLDLADEVVPMAFLVFPAADGTMTLNPHDATLEGPSIRVERIGVIGDVKHNIGYWLDPAATASWPVGIGAAQEGEYRVELELACADAAAGSRMRFEVEGGAGVSEFTVPATGGWQSYRTIEVGRTSLPLGSHTAVLRALSRAGEAVVNVRAIRLVPVR